MLKPATAAPHARDRLARGQGAWLAMCAERRAIRGDLREEGEKAGLSLVHAYTPQMCQRGDDAAGRR